MTGTCRYCGQTMMTISEVEAIANEIATNECKCPEGMEFRNMEQWKIDAKENIDALTEDVGDLAKSAMRSVVDAIAAGMCKKVSFKVNERINITILLKKDCIDVERSFKEKNTLSAEKL